MPNIVQWLETLMNVFNLRQFTVLPFFLLLFFLYKILFSNHPTRKRLPPSPKKLPIIGNLHQIDQLPHRSLHKLSKHHGELMLLHFGKKPVLIVSSAEAASEIMKTHDIIFSDRPALSMFKRLLYDCKDVATAPYGDYWRRMRSICVNQLLNYKRVQSFHKVREEEIAEMIEEIGRSQTAVNLSKMFANLTSDVICRVAFGMKFNGVRDGINFKELQEKHEELVGSINVGDFIPWLAWINHVNGLEREIKNTSRAMDWFLEGIVQLHSDRLSQGPGRNQGTNYDKTQDFVDVLLELQQEHTAEMSINKESIKAIILLK
ncbi:hypothetical protein BVRB_7g177210 [Beta vulgaris subsp. vulgaris]|nr:hypothetical protein BVRB_7g177210 [Beta vulgaris subsp. vulgaris]